MPGNRRAPIMADDGGLRFAQRLHEADHVADRVEDAVGGNLGRRAGAAITAHVGRHDMEAGGCECWNLVAPGVGQFGPAVTEHDQGAFAFLPDENVDAVGRNRARG